MESKGKAQTKKRRPHKNSFLFLMHARTFFSSSTLLRQQRCFSDAAAATASRSDSLFHSLLDWAFLVFTDRLSR